MVQRFLNEWGALPPRVRFGIRNLTAVLGGALVAVVLEGGDITNWATLKGALVAGALKFFVGVFTPEEPFVGFNKPEVVEVPSPPAIKEN